MKSLIPYGINVWNETDDNLMSTYASGIPFLVCRKDYDWTSFAYEADGKTEINCGWEASHVCFLGHVSTWDCGTGSWKTTRGDLSREQFIGDTLGEIHIIYADGEIVKIPLIFGFTLWWDQPLRHNTGHGPYHEPFCSEPESQKILDDSLFLNRFREESENEIYERGMAYHSIIETRQYKISSIRIIRNTKYYGEPLFTGLTVLSPKEITNLYPFPKPFSTISLNEKKIINESHIHPSFHKKRLKRLQRILYTFREDCEKEFSLEIPEGFPGPDIRFQGSRYAAMLTNMYYANLQDLIDKIDWRNQMTPTSTKKAPAWGEYRNSIGTWKKNLGRGNHKTYAGVWSRDGSKAGIERRRFCLGYITPKEIDSFDRCLYAAKPPHWPRDITNIYGVHSSYDQYTKDGHRIIGVPENDGHGAVMVLRYIDWECSENRTAWFQQHWQATIDSTEWICWIMEQKFSDEQPDDVVWSVTEPSGYGGWDIYSNAYCLLGLSSSIIIAEHHNENTFVQRWKEFEQRLKNGIKKHIVNQENSVWKMSEKSLWQDHDEALAPIFAAADLYGYSLEKFPFDEEWMDICFKTYKGRILSEPKYNHARAFGYGYGFLLQTALLFDMADDTEALIKNMCDHSYYAKLYPWIVPEGTVVHPSGDYWYRSGDHGNTAQQVELLKIIRIITGIDDTEPGVLKIMPRLPDSITGVRVDRFTVRDKEGSTFEISYSLKRTETGILFTGNMNCYSGSVEIRLGGYKSEKNLSIRSSQNCSEKHVMHHGRRWIWLGFEQGVKELSIEMLPDC